MSNQNNKKINKIPFIVICTSLTIASFAVIPSLTKKYSNKIYKNTVNTKQIDFDKMGPEIIPIDKKQEEVDG